MDEEKKEVMIEILDEKGRCENTKNECRVIYFLAVGLSGLRDNSGKVLIEKKLSGQPSYAAGRIKDKLRPIVEGLEEARQFPPDSNPAKYNSELGEIKSEYGKFDGMGNFAFYEGTTEDERIEYRERTAKLKSKYPDVEKEVETINMKLRAMGKQKVQWEPHLIDIESQLGKLSPDDWEWFGRTDKDGKFLFLNGTKERLEECLKEFKEDERKAKKKGCKED
jgi:hypothetical protein